jgi:hypothetical protein
MMEALGDPCLRTDRQRQLLKPHVAARGLGVIERAAQRKAIEALGLEALLKQQIERWVGKKVWSQRQRPLGQAQALEHHPGHGFARREDGLGL